jgi:hypothetical protein
MEIELIYKLPVSTSDCLTAQLSTENTDLLLRVEYEDHSDVVRSCVIRFMHVQLFRFENETHSDVYPPGAYDAVVRVRQSAWAAEIELFEVTHKRQSPWAKNHFCIFVSSKGQLNVIAESVDVESTP